MFDQRDGFSSRDFDNADRQLAKAAGVEDIIALIREHEVFAAPQYHAHLRQLRYYYERDARDSPDAFQAFLNSYDTFFTMMHYRVHVSVEDHEQIAAVADPFAPDYLGAVMDSVRDRPPRREGPTFVLPDNLTDFEVELRSHLGDSPALPAYAVTPGACFSVLLLQCMNCQHERVALRCYGADLRVDTQWLEVLTTRRVNGDVCPQCGTTKSTVSRTWVIERPFPDDSLLALSCLCRVSESEMIFMPPPGSRRRPEFDRIYEIRMEMMARQLGASWQADADVGVQTNGVAYNADELAKRLQLGAQENRHQKEYDDIVQTLVDKISSGALPIRDAQRFLSEMNQSTLRDWPLIEATGGTPIEVLVARLVFAACIEARSASGVAKISAHCKIADALISLRELGLAEMSIARARDLLSSVPSEDTASAALICRNAEEWMHTARGEHEKAAAIRQELQHSLKEDDGDSPAHRLVQVSLRMNDALDLLSAWRLFEAHTMMVRDLQELTELEQLLRSTDPTEALNARRSRSGTLSNLSALLSRAADGLDLIAAISTCEGDFNKLSEQARRTVSALERPERLQLMYREVLERLPEVLGSDLDAGALRERAEQGFREAIALAESVGSYEYLAVQWSQLANLLANLGRREDERGALSAAIRSAERAGDQRRVAAGHWAEALNAREMGDQAELFTALEKCLRASLRSQLKSGESNRDLGHIGALALAAAGNESTLLRAITIAEGAKSIPLARSMNVGAIEQAAPQASALRALEREREQLRVELMWGEVDDGTARERLIHLDGAIDRARRELAQRDPRYAAWHDVTFLEPPSAAWLLSAMGKLGARTILLGFTVSAGIGYAYALQGGHCVVASMPKELKSDDPVPWLSGLCSGLESLLSKLTPEDHVLISPCEELRSVPWATVSIAGRPLVERASHSILEGLGMLGVCLERPPLGRTQAFAIGAPARPDQVPLQSAVEELRLVTDVLRQAGFDAPDAVTGAQATVTALCRSSPACDVLHLACHAEPPSEDQAARLLLAPNLVSGDSGALTDGRILTEVALRPGAMVVMASCGSGRPGASLRFIERGLVPACLVVGATTVVATLWPIEDKAALALLTTFYRHFAEGCEPAAALARTQRKAARGDLGEKLQNPQHWAAYEIYGLR